MIAKPKNTAFCINYIYIPGSSIIFSDRMRSEKGVSPLIAAVLLIVMAVTIAGLVFSWLNTFTTSTQRKVENRTSEAVNCAGASLRIREVYLQNGSAATVRVVVENTGYVNNLTISGAQVLNTTGHNFTANNTPLMFNRGEIVTVLFIGVSMTQCANFSKVLVGTQCGGINDEWTDTPKGC